MKIFAAVVSFLFVVGFTCCSFADEAAGQKTYDAKCKSCHGKAGEGNPAIAKALKVDPAVLPLKDLKATDADLVKVIKEGKDKMPSYKDKLKDDEVNDVVKHIRSLK